MNVNVNGALRLVTGKKSIRLDLPPGATLIDCLAEIIRLYPAMQDEMMEEDGSLRTDLPLFVNGRNPRLLPESTGFVLHPEDTLSLFSPVSSSRMNVEVMRQPAARKDGDKDEG